MSTPLRIAFAGTPSFAVPILKRLIDDGTAPVVVYTQPDRPAGRGRRIAPGPVKALALDRGLQVKQPATLKDDAVEREFRALNPDVMIVAAYGQILPVAILGVPTHGCVNVHASLLPRWRGAAPVARAIEAGDRRTGVSIMLMDAGLDTGGVIAARGIDVDDDDNSGTLAEKLAKLGAKTLVECLPGYVAGRLQPVCQDNARATYAPKLVKTEAPIDWSMRAVDVRNKIRALNPWPVACTHHRGNRIRVLEAELLEHLDSADGETGVVREADKAGVVVACGDGGLRLTRLQRDHGKPLRARDFLNGYPIVRGDRLGSSLPDG